MLHHKYTKYMEKTKENYPAGKQESRKTGINTEQVTGTNTKQEENEETSNCLLYPLS
jgi:hypothetical protein